MNPYGIAITLLTIVVAATANAWAHPFHVSIAEAEWNDESGRLEVAMRLNPVDLEQTLRQRSGLPIDLDKSGRIEQLVEQYLRSSFFAKDREGQRCEIEWVGKETTIREAWIYFEVALPNGLDGVSFGNVFLFERMADQVNTVNFHSGNKRQSLRFTVEQPEQVLRFPASEGTDR